jgi:hypothetical protein
MKEKKFYVTYRTTALAPTPIGVPKRIEIHRAIECPDEHSMMECARDIYSYDGIDNLRINRCGRIAKGTTVHSYEDYRAGKFGL